MKYEIKDILDKFTHTKALIHNLEKEYEQKHKGDIYFKRHSYYRGKLKGLTDILTSYCMPKSPKIQAWEIVYEKVIKEDITVNDKAYISLDSTFKADEIITLFQFNTGQVVLSIKAINEPIEIGKVFYPSEEQE